MTKQPAIHLLGDLNAATRGILTGAEIKAWLQYPGSYCLTADEGGQQ
jgi:hypothetical protein